MGRKNRLPPSQGTVKKSDNGVPAFFKHRKQQQQQQQQAGHSSLPNDKGKQREQQSQGLADAILQATSISANDGDVASSHLNSSSRNGATWSSGYEHLNTANFQGATKDSSVRAYGRHLRSLIEQSDVLIQILDARDPQGSRSISTEALIGAHPGKKLLFVLTKVDLVPKRILQAWLLHLRQYHPTLAFKSASTLSSSGRASRKLYTQTSSSSSTAASSSLEGSTAATLLQLLKNYARSQPKGMSLTVGIFGQPNVGKSSLINSLVRSRACSVAPRPGETKALQTVLLDRKVRLIDSPGVAMSASARAGGDLLSATTAEVLKGVVKLELVEDPMTPVAEILRRADPIKVTKLYDLPPLDDGLATNETTAATTTGVPEEAIAEAQPIIADDEPAKGSRVDFNSIRDRDATSDDGMESDDDMDAHDFHRDTFEDDSELVDDNASQTSHDAHFNRATQTCVGYDVTDPMDFLLRLALTKGKMLRGGKPDVEGAARGVINDWNSGKISWHVAPPAGSMAKASNKQRTVDSKGIVDGSHGREHDENMQVASVVPMPSGEAPMTNEEATVVSGFAEAFDLDGLFAAADAQIFGTGAANTSETQPRSSNTVSPAAVQTQQNSLRASDVSATSLGKRARTANSDDESGEETDSSDPDSDSDDDLEPSDKRMGIDVPLRDVTQANSADEEMKPKAADSAQKRGGARATATQSTDELSSFLNPDQRKKGKQPHVPAHIAHAQERTDQAAAMGNGNASTAKKRGQRNKKSKHQGSSGSAPAYLDRQTHKASLPMRTRKTVDVELAPDLGLGGARGKKGDERRKQRKLARRGAARGDDVWQGLEEVTLD